MRSRFALLPGLLIGVVLGVLLAGGMIRVLSQGARNEAVPRSVTPRGPLAEDEKSMIGLFHKASASVVYITTRAAQMDLWTRNVFEVPQGTGSGFVWDEQGHVVTNYHVVQGADKAEVALGEDTYEAEFVGGAPDQDLAVLRIKAPRDKLVPIKVGTSADIEVGQKVLADPSTGSSRRTPPSTPATPAGPSSTARAGSSGSTPRSTVRRGPRRASASRFRWIP